MGRWLAVSLVGMAVVGATSARAQAIQAGTLEFTLAAGGGATLPNKELDTVTSVHLLPHLGYFLTGEAGPEAIRGNLEVLIEPTLLYLDAGSSATVVGVAILPRWVFATSSRVRPYLELGAGVLGGEVDFRQTNCDINFLLEGGAGTLIFMSERVALTIGARFHHVSNGDLCRENKGINSIIGIVGATYFFQ